MTGADEYEGLNVLARLAAGLLTMEAWLRVHRLADAAVADVLEHMWQWPTVKPDTFRPWIDFHSDELQAAEAGQPLPRRIALACQERGASPEDLAALLADIVNIVYDSLFCALDLDLSLARLRNIEVVAARSGVRLPAAQRFASLKAEDKHGWGIPVSAMQVADWRGEPSRQGLARIDDDGTFRFEPPGRPPDGTSVRENRSQHADVVGDDHGRVG